MFCATCCQTMNTQVRFCSGCGKPLAVQAMWKAPAARITRPRYGRMAAGVCAGIADAYGWDPVLVRLGAVVLFFAGFGSVLIAYIAAWVVMPNGPELWTMPVTPGYTGGVTPAGGAPLV